MISLIVSTLLATSALAAPAPQNIDGPAVYESKALCNENSPQTISFYVGPQKDMVLPDVCQSLQCGGEVCPMTIDYTLNKNKTATYKGVNILDESGNKVGDKYSAWFTVHPPPNAGETPVTWTADNCYSFFNQTTTDCAGNPGIHTGSLTVGKLTSGRDTGLAGASIEITILPAGQTQPVVG